MTSILIIDDEPDILDTFADILEEEGYMVATAVNGVLGLALQSSNPVDVVITDIVMPEKEGMETIFELRSEYPDLKIIAISGAGKGRQDNYLSVAEDFGADLTLTKPVSPQELQNAVKRVLK